jgi:hypothetical protein
MTVGMTFQQAVIIGLVHTKSYDYRYVLSAGQDCRIGFSASCDISFHGPVYVHNHIVLLTINPGIWLCDHVAGTKHFVTTYPIHLQRQDYDCSMFLLNLLPVYQYWRCPNPQNSTIWTFQIYKLIRLSLCAWSIHVNHLSLRQLCVNMCGKE